MVGSGRIGERKEGSQERGVLTCEEEREVEEKEEEILAGVSYVLKSNLTGLNLQHLGLEAGACKTLLR